jgi:hypothetical protein
MNKLTANRLKVAAALVCMALAASTLLPVYLILEGLPGVAAESRSHFQWKLVAYLGELIMSSLIAVVLLRSRRAEPKAEETSAASSMDE